MINGSTQVISNFSRANHTHVGLVKNDGVCECECEFEFECEAICNNLLIATQKALSRIMVMMMIMRPKWTFLRLSQSSSSNFSQKLTPPCRLHVVCAPICEWSSSSSNFTDHFYSQLIELTFYESRSILWLR